MNESNAIVVLGAGGHGKAVVGAAQTAGLQVAAVYDDDESKWGQRLLGVLISGPIEAALRSQPAPAVAAVADSRVRAELVRRLQTQWHTLVHPTACIHPSVVLGEGAVVLERAVVQAGAEIGEHAILNVHAAVPHDCILEPYVHVAPGVALAGGVRVSEGALIGTGASTVPNVCIGAWSVVGAGATVVSDIPDRVVVVGTPARIVGRVEQRSTPAGVD